MRLGAVRRLGHGLLVKLDGGVDVAARQGGAPLVDERGLGGEGDGRQGRDKGGEDAHTKLCTRFALERFAAAIESAASQWPTPSLSTSAPPSPSSTPTSCRRGRRAHWPRRG